METYRGEDDGDGGSGIDGGGIPVDPAERGDLGDGGVGHRGRRDEAG